MAEIECVVERCNKGMCIIFDTCDTRKKLGTKRAELTPLEKAEKEKDELQKRIADLEKAIPKIKVEPSFAPISDPVVIVTPNENKKPKGRPRKNG